MYAVTTQKSFSSNPLQIEQEVIPEFLEFFTFGIILLDTHGKVRNINSAAKSIINHCGMLVAAINRPFRVLDVTNNNKLQTIIAFNQNDHSTTKQLLVKKVNCNKQIFIQVSQCLNLIKQGGQGSLIFIRDISQTNELSINNLKIMFQLSPSEAEVAYALVNGKSLHDIAKQRIRSIATVRSQLKSIFIKTGANSQQELIRLSYQSLFPIKLDS